MLIPFRVKNPVRHFPTATVAIIGFNLLMYVLTTDGLLTVKRSVVDTYAFGIGIRPLPLFLSAIFIHGDIFHIVGNMLFFAVFGPAVEDRLRIPRYLLLYLAAGFAGFVVQAGLDILAVGHITVGIGASGCIMGVVGAYWYLYPWSKVTIFYWLFAFVAGFKEVAAIYIIALFVLLDAVNGAMMGGVGGTGIASFGHVGAGVVGAMLCKTMGARRDTDVLSGVKALQSEVKNLTHLPLDVLEVMAAEEPGRTDVLRALMGVALRMNRPSAVAAAIANAGPGLMDEDPALVAYYLHDFGGNPTGYQPVQLLRLAGIMERSGEADRALGVYKCIAEHYSETPEAEMALYRMALCAWNALGDALLARRYLVELASRFPDGEMSVHGRALAARLPQA